MKELVEIVGNNKRARLFEKSALGQFKRTSGD